MTREDLDLMYEYVDARLELERLNQLESLPNLPDDVNEAISKARIEAHMKQYELWMKLEWRIKQDEK